ncbi:hypothetical protein HGO75_19245, partial [Mycobacterium tuberculosis]|nr:hypothetical protein [Mycobacterium tuberculosis]
TVLPYSNDLSRFPAYLQQLTMESNGKSTRADGSTVELAGCGSTHVEPGDTLVIETPGGGGYGPASTSARRRR